MVGLSWFDLQRSATCAKKTLACLDQFCHFARNVQRFGSGLGNLISCQHLKLHVRACGVSHGGTTVSMSVWTKAGTALGGFPALTSELALCPRRDEGTD